MKQIAKTLIASLIVLSILATTCVIGISAVAATTEKKEFILVSETAEKKVSDMTATHTVNGTKDFSVVAVSTLTGGDTYTGAATTAYKANITAGKEKDGFWVSAPDPDFSEFAFDYEGHRLEAWIYVSDITALGSGLIRFYISKEANAAGSHVENYICQGGLSDIGVTKSGWNKVDIIMNWNNNDWQFGNATWANMFFSSGAKLVGVGIHAHGAAGASKNVSVAVASMKITRNNTVVPASVTKDYIVSATEDEYPGVIVENHSTLGTDTYNGAVRGAYTLTHGLLIRKGFPAKDMSAKGTTVSLWMYVGDTSKAKAVTVELGNFWNANDVHEFQYVIQPAAMKQGWNEYVIEVPETAGTTGKIFYAKSVTRLRMFTNYVAEAGMKFGEIYVNYPKTVTTDTNTSGQTIVSPDITKLAADITPTAPRP